MQVAFPLHGTEKFAQADLPLAAGKQAQRRFHRLALGGQAARCHGFRHQLVVDLDIGPHRPPHVY